MTVPLWYKINIKSGRKTANIKQILIQKTSEVLSLLRPIVHDTSKTAKITWFILVLYWAMDVIYDFYYIHGPMILYFLCTTMAQSSKFHENCGFFDVNTP